MSNKLVAGGFSQGQVDRWRNKIQVGMAIETLNKAIEGKIEPTTARMKAVEIALRKTVPDLSSVELTSGGQPIQFTWGKAETIIDMTADNQDIQPNTAQDISDTRHLEMGVDGVNDAHTSPPEKQDTSLDDT